VVEEDSEKIFSRVVRTVITEMRELNQMLMKPVHEEVMVCNAHNRECCHKRSTTVAKCHAMLASELTVECGCKLVVVADA